MAAPSVRLWKNELIETRIVWPSITSCTMRVLAPHDVGREIDDHLGRVGERGAFTGADADAQRHLRAPGRSCRRAAARRSRGARRGTSRSSPDRATGGVRNAGLPSTTSARTVVRKPSVGSSDRFGERRIGDVGDAVERVADDVELELGLGVGGDVLPTAAAATFAGVHARRDRRARATASSTSTTRPRRWSARSAVTSIRTRSPGRAPSISATRPSSARASASPPATMRVAVSSTGTSQARTLRDSRIVKALRVHELGEPEQVMVLEDAPGARGPAR